MNKTLLERHSKRKSNQARKIHITKDYIHNADASCLINVGKTSIICTASIETKIPNWLKGSGKGWLTAEYSMLPASTHTRNNRESAQGKQSGRTLEIQRLIGRSLRASLDLEKLQELQIKIDCDVINADGGTRTASITGGWVVLKMLVESLIKNKTLKNNPIKDQVAAISCGIFKGEEILDLDYFEDSNTEIDANFVVSKSKNLIEVQATAEKGGFTKTQLNTLIDMACKECDNLFSIQSEVIKNEK
ncbi:MAG: ribonuclease PH [Alphaproteobacteria bacterium]|nr:ribonuclease PH [Alphaproteobacteria bacterium]|tara:strand:+ start:169 stop:909 length:741 start_codon:yes stop_codon:yes gene_type:complete